MLLQTNSYIVPKEKRAEHARLMRRFRQILNRVGCDNFEVYEQAGTNWSGAPTAGRFVQIMRFRDRRHQLAVQNAERTDPAAQQLIAEFCELINYPYQQQQQQFAVGFYSSVLPVAPVRGEAAAGEEGGAAAPAEPFGAAAAVETPVEAGPEAMAEAVADETSEPDAAEPEVAAADEAASEDVGEQSAGGPIAEESAEIGEEGLTTEGVEAEAAATDEGLSEETLAEDLFADDELSMPEPPSAENAPAETGPAGEDTVASGEAAEADPFGEVHGLALDDELSLEDPEDAPGDADEDDISRLAEELSAGDPEAHARPRPVRRGPGASENGAH